MQFIGTDWNKALTFGVSSIKLSFCAIVFTQYMYTKIFSIRMLLYTFQLNCAEGFHFSVFRVRPNHLLRFLASSTHFIIMAELNARGLQSKLLITPLSE